jgi:methyltransferase (TIGR00027 family)
VAAKKAVEPDKSAVRTALWRALHLEVDDPPHVISDEVGLQLADPGENWRRRPDMARNGTRGFRGSIVARARFVEDLVVEQFEAGVEQYVILGAGLDTFAQRRTDIVGRMRVFEIDQPGTQAWKAQRLEELGYGTPDWLRFVPVDFEKSVAWWDRLVEEGFDPSRPVVLACTGVLMYLTPDAVFDTLRQAGQAASGSTLAATYLLPTAFDDPANRPGAQPEQNERKAPKARWRSFFTPDEIGELALKAGFREVRHVSTEDLVERYFADRSDGFGPSSGEPFVVAST